MNKNKSLIASVSWGVFICFFCLLTSCLKGGEESIALQSGEADELILGGWKVDDCVFTYVDDEGKTIEEKIPSNMQWGTLLQPKTTLDFAFSGSCTINGGQSVSYSIDAMDDEFVLNGNTYDLVSIGKNLMVLEAGITITKPDGTSVNGTLRYSLIRASEGETVDKDDTDDGTGIPSDSKAEPNPTITGTPTATIPNIQLQPEGNGVIRLDMTGVQDKNTGNWLKLYGTGSPNQNIWVEVDDTPKGIVVVNNDENSGSVAKPMLDLVFCVDNSGSMSEEADKLATEIVAWATKLANQNLDIRFGCVGYESGVNGAIDLTDLTSISSYLNRAKGTSRTRGFEGANSSALQQTANSYFQNGHYECGAEAVHFADQNFNFRTGANRIYVNFTDEPNQPGNNDDISVNSFNPSTGMWQTTQGTIHTVYSETQLTSSSYGYNERPELMSDYTGGTTIYTTGSFNVSLDQLPVTGAMSNSYVIRFREPVTSGTHKVKITVQENSVKAERIFTNVTF